MIELMIIVLTVIFPMSNAQASENVYTTYTIDPQRDMVIRCTLAKVKNKNVIVCTEKPIKEVRNK